MQHKSREIPSDIHELNDRLRDYFGIFEDGRSNYRIVWSADQFEMRFGTYKNISPSGLYLGEVTEYRFVPKYKQWMPNEWVLEKLTPVPSSNEKELTVKTSYEPLWGFRTLTPTWGEVRALIEHLYDAMNRAKGIRRYKEGIEDLNTKEAIKERVDKLKRILDEQLDSPIADALHFGEGVAIPHKQFGDN